MMRLSAHFTVCILSVSMLSLLTACDDHALQDGIAAFHAGEFQKAVQLLEPLAKDQATKQPEFQASGDSHTTPQEVAPYVTKDYFAGWEAYSGSLFGLSRLEEGCKAVAIGLRPLKIKVNRGSPVELDPRAGNYWPAETFSLRSWWDQIPCH